MRPYFTSTPDDIASVLAAAVQRGLGKLLLAVGMAGLMSVATVSFMTAKHASQLRIEFVSKALAAPFEPGGETGAPHLFAVPSSDLMLERAANLGLAATREFNALVELGATPSGDETSPMADMMAPVAMLATLLLGLAFMLSRELLATSRHAPLRKAARTQASLVTSAMRSLAPAAGQPTTRVRTTPSAVRRIVADAPNRTGFRTPPVGEAAGIVAEARVAELTERLVRQGWPVSCSAAAPAVPGGHGRPVHRPRSAPTARHQGPPPSRMSSPSTPPGKFPLPPPARTWPVPLPPAGLYGQDRREVLAIGGR